MNLTQTKMLVSILVASAHSATAFADPSTGNPSSKNQTCQGLRNLIRPDAKTGLFMLKKTSEAHCINFSSFSDEPSAIDSVAYYELGSAENTGFARSTTIDGKPHHVLNFKELSANPKFKDELKQYGGFYLEYGSECESCGYSHQKFIISHDDEKACAYLQTQKQEIESLSPKIECGGDITEQEGFLTIHEEHLWEFIQLDIIHNGQRKKVISSDDLKNTKAGIRLGGNTYVDLSKIYAQNPLLENENAYAILWQDRMDIGAQYCVFGKNKAHLQQKAKGELKAFYPRDKMRFEFQDY